MGNIGIAIGGGRAFSVPVVVIVLILAVIVVRHLLPNPAKAKKNQQNH